MKSKESKRIEEIDLIKAFAIIGMVWGHIGLPGSHFWYLFHMAVFFICSGVVYKEKYSVNFSSVVTFIKNKLRALYVPYVFCAILFTLLHNTFIRIGFYNPSEYSYLNCKKIIIDCIRAVLFVRGTPLSGPTWFLHALFFISVFHCFYNFVINQLNIKKNWYIQIICSSLLLIILFVMKKPLQELGAIHDYVGHFIIGYFCYCLGTGFSYFGILPKLKQGSFVLKLIFFSASLVLLIVAGNAGGGISIAEVKFKDPLYFFVMSVSGFLFLFGIALLLNHAEQIKSNFVFLGKNTLPVVLWHILVFKFVNVLFVYLFNLDKTLISAYPTFYGQIDNHKFIVGGGGYLCIGVLLPVIIHILREKLFNLWRKNHD